MATQPNCNTRLSPTQVRNPRLGSDKDGTAWIESSPWGVGETTLFAAGGFIVGGIVGAVLAFLADVITGLVAGDMVSPPAYIIGSGIPAVGLFTLIFWMQYIAPSIWKPLEFNTPIQRNAYLKYQTLDRERQLEVSNAFKALMNADKATVIEANRVWDSTLVLINKREALIHKQIAVPEPDDVYLEEARHTLNSLEQEIHDMEKMND